MRSLIRLAGTGALVLAIAGCNSDLTKSASPIALIASNTQTLNRIDLAGGANCDQSLGVIHLQAVEKNPGASQNPTFNQVRITGYRVSYVRTDGGKLVPAPFQRAMDSLITPGGEAQDLSGFLALLPEALNQAPFAALQPNNGGRDPDTGLPVVRMNLIVEVFGTTLAGERVSASTVMPVDFCYNCGGCS